MFKLFLTEPLWFKLLTSITLMISIVFSSSFFSGVAYYESISKLAAAIFFCVFGYKMRGNRVHFVIFFTLAGVCIFLSLLNLSKA